MSLEYNKWQDGHPYGLSGSGDNKNCMLAEWNQEDADFRWKPYPCTADRRNTYGTRFRPPGECTVKTLIEKKVK